LPECGPLSSRDNPPAFISGVTRLSNTAGNRRNPNTVKPLATPTEDERAGLRVSRTIRRATFSGRSTGGGGRPMRPA
jgi:hypothetical protein